MINFPLRFVGRQKVIFSRVRHLWISLPAEKAEYGLCQVQVSQEGRWKKTNCLLLQLHRKRWSSTKKTKTTTAELSAKSFQHRTRRTMSSPPESAASETNPKDE